MGTWLNVAFVQSADVDRVRRELSGLLIERGRRLTTPKPRTPERSDRMQYGRGDEVLRWGIAGFRGAPGWTAVRTAPFELLMQGDRPLLACLAERLGAPGFQYNIHDSSSGLLMEADASGRVELSGYVSHEPSEYWNGDPPMDRMEPRFHIIDPSDVAAWAETAMPEARVKVMDTSKGNLENEEPALARWLRDIGAEVGPLPLDCQPGFYGVWTFHPSHAIRKFAQASDDGIFLDPDWCVEPAFKIVFGGPNAEHCDNLFMVQTLRARRKITGMTPSGRAAKRRSARYSETGVKRPHLGDANRP
jgi:hypothetical protein